MGLLDRANPIRHIGEQTDDFFDDVGQQIDDLSHGDFRTSFDHMFDDMSSTFLTSNATLNTGPWLDWNEVLSKDSWEDLQTAAGNAWDGVQDLFKGLGLPAAGGGDVNFPAWPESERRHTGGPSSGDFYMDIYSGGLEGGNIAGKKYGLGAPENANYRGVLGVY